MHKSLNKVKTMAFHLVIITLLLNAFIVRAETIQQFTYSAEYKNQDNYPSPAYPGREYEWWVEFRNTGTGNWYPRVVKLGCGTASNHDQLYDIVHESWGDNFRPTNLDGGDSNIVAPGEIGRFTFKIRIPENAQTGVTKRYNFTPVREGIAWMKKPDGSELNVFMDITVSEPPANRASNGNILEPQGFEIGLVNVEASASDFEGLRKVSLLFAENSRPLVLCEDGTANYCEGTSGTWIVPGVNPEDHGITASGNINLELWVLDGEREVTLAATKTIAWTKPTPPPTNSDSTGEITQPGAAREKGIFVIDATVEDPDGLHRVYATLNGDPTRPEVLCGFGSETPCSGTSAELKKYNVIPENHGISEPTDIQLDLYVTDKEGITQKVDTHTFPWEEYIPKQREPFGRLIQPDGLAQGDLVLAFKVSDINGLNRAVAEFLPSGKTIVLCDDETDTPCDRETVHWVKEDVAPSEVGVQPGTNTINLYAQDDYGLNDNLLAESGSFVWVPEDNQFPIEGGAIDICKGRNFEQIKAPGQTERPHVFIHGPSTAQPGEIITLHAQYSVDFAAGAEPFFVWCAERGELIYDEANPDTVQFVVPFVPGVFETVEVFVQIGDNLGFIHSDILTISVSGNLKKAEQNSGIIQQDQIIQHAVRMDDYVGKLVAFLVKWPGSDVELVPRTPQGLEIDTSHENLVGYFDGDVQEYFVFYNGIPGIWNIDLIGKEIDPGGEEYEFSVWVEEPGGNDQEDKDSDGDGLPDSYEMAFFNDLDQNRETDFDGDGLADGEEYDFKTNPTLMDTDQDGMPDGYERDNGLNPLKDDADGDPDGDDVGSGLEFINGTEPNQADRIYHGMRGFWKMDEYSGETVFDTSGNGNHGRIINYAEKTWNRVAGKKNGALDLTEGYNFVSIPDYGGLSLGGPMTFGLWVKLNDLNTASLLYKTAEETLNQDNYTVKFSSNRGFYVGIEDERDNDDNLTGTTTQPTMENWYHVAGVYDGNKIAVYVNGALEGAKETGAFTPHTGLADLVFGTNFFSSHWRGGNDSWANAAIDEVFLYDRALSPSEIREFFIHTTPTAVTLERVIIDLKILTGQSTDYYDPAALDVTGDGVVDLKDAIMLLQKAAGLRE